MQIDVLTGSVSEDWSLEINIYFTFFLKDLFLFYVYGHFAYALHECLMPLEASRGCEIPWNWSQTAGTAM